MIKSVKKKAITNYSSPIKAKIRGIAFGGAGVGIASEPEQIAGKVFFIPFTCTDDEVIAVTSKEALEPKGKRHSEASLLELVNSSPKRTKPKCQHFKVCGGCKLQHISYEHQLEAKLEMIKSSLKAGGVAKEIINKVEPIISSTPYKYRLRTSLHISDAGEVGFFKPRTHEVLPLNECPVLTEELEKLMLRMREVGEILKGCGGVVNLIAYKEQTGIHLEINHDSANKRFIAAKEILQKYSQSGVITCRKDTLAQWGNRYIKLPLNKEESIFSNIPIGGFSQVNWSINQKLISSIKEYAIQKDISTAIDLYAGSGNLSLPLAEIGTKITAVECAPLLISGYKESVREANLQRNFSIKKATVGNYLKARNNNKRKGPDRKKELFDLIIADPPRSGLGKIAKQLNFAQNLCLISCYIPSLVRDLKNLSELGWNVETIECFDMFPQSSYCEVVVKLYRKGFSFDSEQSYC